MSTKQAQFDARAVIERLASLGNKIETYIGPKGAIPIVGYIDPESADQFGLDGLISDNTQFASLLVEDVGQPHRGDFLIDEDGQEWEMLAKRAQPDPYVVEWEVQRR